MSPPRRAPVDPRAPHPPLTVYYPYEAARHGWVRAVFDRTTSDGPVARHVEPGLFSEYRAKKPA